MNQFVINGRFLTRKTTGVERFAYEILCELDSIVRDDEIMIAVPNTQIRKLNLNKIQVQCVGKSKGNMWEQIDLPLFIRKHKAIGIHLCNTAPLVKPDVVCIHDMNIRVYPENFKFLFVLWYHIQYRVSTTFAKALFTVSEFSKEEMIKYYPLAREKCHVVSNGWQHMRHVEQDDTIFEKYPILLKQIYFFAMSSNSPNKNLKWILQAAKENPQYLFVVAGKIKDKVFQEVDRECMSNVLYTGYVSDGEAKSLMQKARAFLFPSFYEGFGMPPLEALGVGTNAIVSNIPVHREVYEKSVAYIDPNDANVDLESISKQFGHIQIYREAILNKYSYADSAKKILEVIRRINR